MISLNTKQYCKDDVSLIENYDIALADNDNVWECHHRLETHKRDHKTGKFSIERGEEVSKQTLISFGLYYKRPADELIFMKHGEHSSMHNKKERKGKTPWNKGKKGVQSSWCKGMSFTDEYKNKISEGTKNAMKSNEVRERCKEGCKVRGKHWRLVNGKREWYN